MALNLSEVAAGAERDPFGRSAKNPGAKLDADKPRVGLMLRDFANALMAVAEVTTAGADKYSPSGWLKVPRAAERYDDAKGRHLLEGYAETNESLAVTHLAQEAWNALAVLELKLRMPTTEKGWDE
jgi:hypothetical protein